MNRPLHAGQPSPGQLLGIGYAERSGASSTTSWHAPCATTAGPNRAKSVFAARAAPASSSVTALTFCSNSAMRRVSCGSSSTPRAAQTRRSEPKIFVTAGNLLPLTRSKRSALPPPGDLLTRSVISAISSIGSTSTPIRWSCPVCSSLSRNSRRSCQAMAPPVPGNTVKLIL